jgi:molybdenum cofactor cytidylyltransferase
MSELWGIILAAGESRRMKTQKLLLPFRGKTIIEQVIENIRHSEVNRIMIVLGSGREDIMKAIGHLPVLTCFNENYKMGMLSSIKCGFSTLPPSCKAALIFPGDQPMIPGDVINAVIHAYHDLQKGIVLPVYKGKRGHPVLIDMKYIHEIEKLSEDEGLRSLSYKFSDDVLEVEVNDDGILRDIDTREEYLDAVSMNDNQI